MTPRCSVTGLSCSTAYGKKYGCRCLDCRAWNAERSRKHRENPQEARRPLHAVRMHQLLREADEAFRADPGYVTAMAKAWWD